MRKFIVVVILILGSLALASFIPAGGQPEQNQEFLKALDKIVYAIEHLPDAAEHQKRGFHKVLEVPPVSEALILIVPRGQKFTLRKLYVYAPSYNNWQLETDYDVFLNGQISAMGDLMHDFPDKCVNVHSGQTLKANNFCQNYPLKLTVVGYFYAP
jgi:hypothetical protein